MADTPPPPYTPADVELVAVAKGPDPRSTARSVVRLWQNAPVRPDPPPGLRWTGRQTEIELIDQRCPEHGGECFRRSWVPCQDVSHSDGRGAPGHNVWIFDCGLRLYRTGGDYTTRLDCI